MEDVFEELKAERFAFEPKFIFENLDGTPFGTTEMSPFEILLSELGNKLLELLLDAGL